MSFVLKKSKLDIICNMKNYILSDLQRNKCEEILENLKNHKPWSKIIGQKCFYGLNFYVNEHVLDPRLETEEIVRLSLKELLHDSDESNSKTQITILDLGTGSACLLITLLILIPNSKGIGVDISSQALEIAQKNIDFHKVNADLIKSDWLLDVPKEKFDIIVCNPPYIAKGENVGKEVVYDPDLALYADDDGFACYERILSQIRPFLKVAIFEVPASLKNKFEQHVKRFLPASYFKWHKSTANNIQFIVIKLE